MKTAQDIYTEYKLMPSLQLHQLRVAAVGKTICDNFTQPINTKDVVLACLFHDMGNIIKSDLTYFPDFVQPEGIEYWEQVKGDFVQRYGTDHHRANTAIAKEIGIPALAVALIDSIGFSRIADVVADSSFERKIVQYADTRVGPHGILSWKERFKEGRERYVQTRMSRAYHESDEESQRLYDVAEKLEEQVFAQTTITPADITDANLKATVEELRNFQIH